MMPIMDTTNPESKVCEAAHTKPTPALFDVRMTWPGGREIHVKLCRLHRNMAHTKYTLRGARFSAEPLPGAGVRQ